eukprot:jgi/Mesvir1/8702/Mv26109-RA.2
MDGRGPIHSQEVDDFCNTPASAEIWTRQPPLRIFPCWYPEHQGALCSVTAPSICVNQCSGRGECDRGFCVCQQGYHGIDCSIPVRPATDELLPLRGNEESMGNKEGEADANQDGDGIESGLPNVSKDSLGALGSQDGGPVMAPSGDMDKGRDMTEAEGSDEGQGPGVAGAAPKARPSRKELRLAALAGKASSSASASAPAAARRSSNGLPSGPGGGPVGGDPPSGGGDGTSAPSGAGSGVGSNSRLLLEGRRLKLGRAGMRAVLSAAGHASTQEAVPASAVHVLGGGSPAAAAARRPRIFVYELPPVFNAHLLQLRRQGLCVSREYDIPDMAFNVSKPLPLKFSEWLYNFDFMFLEWLLHSEHRTLDPDEADYFYVPFLTSCYIFLGDESPRMRLIAGRRMVATAQAAKLILQYIRTNYPYWDRSNGADHIWTWVWDEGAAAAPAVIRNSIMITSWGAKYVQPRTAYFADVYMGNELYQHDQRVFGMAFQDGPLGSTEDDWNRFNPRGVTWAGDAEERGSMPGYDPDKDIVVPAPYFAWMDSPYSLYNRWRGGTEIYEGVPGPCIQCPKFNHDKLFYFGGDLGREAHEWAGVGGGRPEAHYSWGIRQAVAKYYLGEEGRKKGMYLFPGPTSHYLKDMAHSVFCGAFPGDGWSHGYVRAILHGCIPVVISDDVEEAFSNVLNYSKISVRVLEKDIPNLHAILAAIPQEQVDMMQANIRRVWPRFVYRRYRADLKNRLQKMGYDVSPMEYQVATVTSADGDDLGSDAMDTIMELLYARLRKREQALGNNG